MDPSTDVAEQAHRPRICLHQQTLAYFAGCFLANGTVSALAVVMWSSMGIGRRTFDVLGAANEYRVYPIGVAVLVLALMYIFDLILSPDETKPQMLRTIVSKVLFVLVCMLFLASCLLLQRQYPFLPLLITMFFSPASIAVVRHCMPKWESGSGLEPIRLRRRNSMDKPEVVSATLQVVDTSVRRFYSGASAALLANSACVLAAWLIWTVVLDRRAPSDSEMSGEVWEEWLILWMSPVIVAICNLMFSLFMCFRVRMQGTYNASVLELAHLDASLKRGPAQQNGQGDLVFESTLGGKSPQREESQNQSASFKYPMFLLKTALCSFIVLLGLLYVAFQLLYANGSIANMVLGLLVTFFVIFVAFVYVSFRRVVVALGRLVKKSPAFKQFKSVMESTWTRALLLCLFFPIFPMVALLSCANQCVRKTRRNYTRVVPMSDTSVGHTSSDTFSMFGISSNDPDVRADKLWLTPRIHSLVRTIRRWDWLAMAPKVYILCSLMFAYNIAPPFFNVGLSWMREALQDWPFAVIVVMTFVVGVFAFLCPVVPGLTVYVFGGMVISGTCPPIGTDTGFWIGSGVNVLMCWALKLCACAVQQKCIGEFLGNRLWVRHQVGVHKLGIRCVESIMSKRGWTIGKVAILCGGPDWPVSVLAGVLRLSLLQCEIGTIPIIFFVAPCALSGSLYLQVGRSELWTRSASLMILLSLCVNFFLWAVAGWAIQNELEQNYEKLSKKLPENVELEWLDYKDAELERMVDLKWADVSSVVRTLFILGAVVHIIVCYCLSFFYSALVGNFQVSDDIERLQWFSGTWYQSGGAVAPTDKISLFTAGALICIGVYSVGWLFYIVFSVWRRSATRAKRPDLENLLGLSEPSIKSDAGGRGRVSG